MHIELSPEQKLFIDKALEGNNILVDACIGSGKTTSIQHLCQAIPSNKSVLYLTYNRLLKIDAKSKISAANITVTNYHGFASAILQKSKIHCGVSDLIQTFNKEKPALPHYDVLIIDEYQDIDTELSDLLKIVKSSNPAIQIIAVGDMKQKIYDRTDLNVIKFINDFLDDHICLEFTLCFRLGYNHAAMLGRIWQKNIVGVNDTCQVSEMTKEEATDFLSCQSPKDILCLGARVGVMPTVLNKLERDFPNTFNKHTVYASISDTDNGIAVEPNSDSAIFTTYDSSKGLEKKICVLFDFTEIYWSIRLNKPQQSYEILRNIFCVAASRGKERIIFVKGKDKLLSEETLSTPNDAQSNLTATMFSEMFDFKYKESIEKAFSLLKTKRLPSVDDEIINIKTRDELIDLSPCIGIFQEASFFNKYDIDKNISLYFTMHPERRDYYNEKIRQSDIDRKILFLTAMETGQLRYINQVSMPYITKSEEELLHKRLASVFSKDDDSQKSCCQIFDGVRDHTFTSYGFADVVKNDIVYELKFVRELTHEHFLQCACYVVALKLKKGILWNTRNNEMYEISIPDEKSFLSEVAKAVLKIKSEKSVINSVTNINNPLQENSNIHFAVIDTETNWMDRVMSIGVCVVNKQTYEIIEKKYYIITNEISYGGMYSYALRMITYPDPKECTRKEAMDDIALFLRKYTIKDVFAYNAKFDYRHLPEMNYVSWYDIMKIAAYKQYNSMIPDHLECYKSGRLKRNYGVEAITVLLKGDNNYQEKHNALYDAIDETNIMKMLRVPYETYIEHALINEATADYPMLEVKEITNSGVEPQNRNNSFHTISSNYWSENESQQNETRDFKTTASISMYDELFGQKAKDELILADEAAAILGISKSKVYDLIRNGSLKAFKIKNQYNIYKESVLAYLEEHRIQRRRWNIFTGVVFGLILLILILSFYYRFRF